MTEQGHGGLAWAPERTALWVRRSFTLRPHLSLSNRALGADPVTLKVVHPPAVEADVMTRHRRGRRRQRQGEGRL
jgi:hypothetical protein